MLRQMAWSKHVVKLHETITSPTRVYLMMEYCVGGDLFERIVREGRLPRSAAARILKSMAEFANDCLSTGTVKQFKMPPKTPVSSSVQ